MPNFLTVTPTVTGKPISMSFVDTNGNTKSTRLNLPPGTTPALAAITTYASAKAALSTGGLYKAVGGGTIRRINRIDAEPYDELYSLATLARVTFVNDDGDEAFDRIPGINYGFTDGATLAVGDATVDAYIAATEAILGGTYQYASSRIEGYEGTERVIPSTPTDPTGQAGAPAPTPI